MNRLRSVQRRDSAKGLTTRKLAELRQVADRFQRARKRYVLEYWGAQHLDRVLRSSHTLVEAKRASGWGDTGLGPHQSKLALESALGLVRSNWKVTLSVARTAVSRDIGITGDLERRWCRYVLKWPALLRACLLGETPVVDENWAKGLDSDRLRSRLRRIVLRCRGGRPRGRSGMWFEIDTNLYRPYVRPNDRHFRGAWVAIAGLTPGRRVNVPLAGKDVTFFGPRPRRHGRPSLRVTIGDRVTLFRTDQVPPTARSGEAVGGIDKGYRSLLTLSTGDPGTAQGFGVGASARIAQIADAAHLRTRQRRRIVTYERSLRNSAAAKARRIRRQNLRGKRQRRRAAAERASLKDQVNAAIHELLRQRGDLRRLVVEDLRFRGRPFPAARLNRWLGRWLKGHLHRRLAYLAELNGVELVVVNAAYTSQTCPSCGFVNRINRQGERFMCRSCGTSGSADAVAATNILRRGSDTAITRLTRHHRVKQILEERWRAAHIGSAWGSNEAAPGEASTLPMLGTSREQPLILSGPKVM